MSEPSWFHLKTFFQWMNISEQLGTRKPSVGKTNPVREHLCVPKVPATIPTTQTHSSCAQRNRQLHRGDAVGQVSLVRHRRIEDAHPGSQMVSMMLVQSATAKAVLVAAQTRARLTLIIITWYSPAVETHSPSL